MVDEQWVRLRAAYDAEAYAYSASLTLEQITEATSQAQQRKITLASLEVVREQVPDLHLFNELLLLDLNVDPVIRVVPDNLVVRYPGTLDVNGHFGIPFQPARPFWALEYASKSNARKDYDRNVLLYQRLQIPYYLIFSPEAEEMILMRLVEGTYRTVVPELETGLALIPEFQLVPLTADLARENRDFRTQLLAQEATILQQNQAIVQTDQLLARKEESLAEMRLLLEAQARELALLRQQITAPPSGA